jgi:hypothetical protein
MMSVARSSNIQKLPTKLVRAEEPKALAMKRRMMSDQVFCAPTIPALKAVKIV